MSARPRTFLASAWASALLSLNGRLHLAGWQWLFLVEGIPALILSIIFLRYLPDKPSDATWLTPQECLWLEGRLAGAEAGAHSSENLWQDLARTLTDVRVLLLCVFWFCMLTVLYAWSFSAPAILIQLTGMSIGQAGTILAIIGLFGAASMLLTAAHSDRKGERNFHIAVPCALMATGYIVGSLTHRPLVAILAFAVSVICYNASQGPAHTLPSIFLRGRSSAIGYATVNMIGMLGGFVGPYWMGAARQLTGDYQRGLLTLAIPSAIAAGLIFVLARVGKPAQFERTATLDAVDAATL